MQSYLIRRVEFLLDEAKADDWKYDNAIIYTLRCLSNYAQFGKDLKTGPIRWKCTCISSKARELYAVSDDKTWLKETINEHQKPLKEIWRWIRENHKTLTAEDVLNEIKNHPINIITKEEDDLIKNKGLKSKGTFEERYLDNGIIIIEAAPVERRKSR